MPVAASLLTNSGKYDLNCGQDNAFERLSLRRASGKRRKSDGLNSRLSRMLFHLNTTCAIDPSGSGTGAKRRRNLSHGSSSSTLVSEVPPTAIETIHKSAKSDSLGEGFAIIKAGSLKIQGPTGLFTNDKLPSWRDADKQNEAEHKNDGSRRELPDWLAQTFATLEPDHPLRALACSDNSSSPFQENAASVFLEAPVIHEVSQTEEPVDDAVFAFVPPKSAQMEEENPEIKLAANKNNTHFSSAAGHLVGEDNEAQGLPAANACEETLKDISGFQPFAQPGPFALKSVHFLTPDRSPPSSASNPSHGLSAALANRASYAQSTYTPFSTPGPAASFSVVSHDRRKANGTDIPYSDMQKFVNESICEEDLYAYSNVDEDAAVSILSFSSNPVDFQDKPFSTPGPIFYTPPAQQHCFVSRADYQLDDVFVSYAIQPANCSPIPDGQHRETPKAMHFTVGEHDNMFQDSFVPGLPGPNDILITPELEEHGAHQNQQFVSEKSQEHTSSPGAIELFSSSPYIRSKLWKGPDKSASYTTPKKAASQCIIPALTPPDMRLERVPTSTFTTNRQDGTSPKSQQHPPVPHIFARQDNVTPTALNNGLDSETKPVGIPTESKIPQKKQRRAFAPCPGINISPIHASDDGPRQMDVESSRPSTARPGTNNIDDVTWNVTLSQLTDDSIEEWET